MRVILVNGSPNENGGTHKALQEVENALKGADIKTEIFHMHRQVVKLPVLWIGSFGCMEKNCEGNLPLVFVVCGVGVRVQRLTNLTNTSQCTRCQ